MPRAGNGLFEDANPAPPRVEASPGHNHEINQNQDISSTRSHRGEPEGQGKAPETIQNHSHGGQERGGMGPPARLHPPHPVRVAPGSRGQECFPLPSRSGGRNCWNSDRLSNSANFILRNKGQCPRHRGLFQLPAAGSAEARAGERRESLLLPAVVVAEGPLPQIPAPKSPRGHRRALLLQGELEAWL